MHFQLPQLSGDVGHTEFFPPLLNPQRQITKDNNALETDATTQVGVIIRKKKRNMREKFPSRTLTSSSRVIVVLFLFPQIPAPTETLTTGNGCNQSDEV